MKKEIATGVTFTQLLTVLFIGTSNITWSWWWVLSPLWLPAAIALTILLIAFIVIGAVAIFAK